MGLLWPLSGGFGGKKEETKSWLPQFGALFVESVVTAFVSTSTHQAGSVVSVPSENGTPAQGLRLATLNWGSVTWQPQKRRLCLRQNGPLGVGLVL